jgi:hypothetical protein
LPFRIVSIGPGSGEELRGVDGGGRYLSVVTSQEIGWIFFNGSKKTVEGRGRGKDEEKEGDKSVHLSSFLVLSLSTEDVRQFQHCVEIR